MIKLNLNRGIGPGLVFVLLSFLLLSLSRLGLYIWVHDEIPEGYSAFIFLQGLRIDVATICGLYIVPFLLLILCVIRPLARILSFAAALLMVLGFAFLVMNEAATPGFILEYGVRPNHIYVAYLKYPKEVFSMLLSGHIVALLSSVVLIILALLLGSYIARKVFKDYEPLRVKGALLTFLIICLIVPAGIRSTTGRRPLNPSMVSFCESQLANSIPLNSSYSAVYAFTHQVPQLSANDIYGFSDDKEIMQAAVSLSAGDFATPNETCLVRQTIVPVNTGKRKNVVILLEESLGAAFVKSLGGDGLTPYLEKLKGDGWWFTNMFATGNRSVRGLEGVTAGYPPSPLHSTVTLPETQNGIANLANIFKSVGYETAFIYGGENHFDNMATYFRGNGTKLLIDQRDYDNPDFVASWGVSDEDLFRRADEQFTKWHQENKPFYALVFTSSFHDPFEIPEGKVKLEGEKSRWSDEKMLAAKYADYALYNYMQKVRQSDYYEDTIFIIIADHESKVYANSSFPVWEYHIPALIMGKDIAPRVDERIVSQIDVAPTLLSLAGIGGTFPFVGQDLNRGNIKERALLGLYETFAYVERDKVAVLHPAKKAFMYRPDFKDQTLSALDNDEEFIKRAAAIENLGPYMYRHGSTSMQKCTLLSD